MAHSVRERRRWIPCAAALVLFLCVSSDALSHDPPDSSEHHDRWEVRFGTELAGRRYYNLTESTARAGYGVPLEFGVSYRLNDHLSLGGRLGLTVTPSFFFVVPGYNSGLRLDWSAPGWKSNGWYLGAETNYVLIWGGCGGEDPEYCEDPEHGNLLLFRGAELVFNAGYRWTFAQDERSLWVGVTAQAAWLLQDDPSVYDHSGPYAGGLTGVDLMFTF